MSGATVEFDYFEIICPDCGKTQKLETAREALDARDFHCLDALHAVHIYAALGTRRIRLVGIACKGVYINP